ncbi:hypothetical protein PoB_007716300 [Plakobranchus ocellatus]|uniref:CS domain-containing protein n=1 Tax=Plakobranchus ocellatus TaxID=259542 RepID=A0AAV4E271_9GAST|nr:hypothetical protein PoB_007716300 [Plakobranchus ocellatus]
MAGLEPATERSLEISGRTHKPLCHRPPRQLGELYYSDLNKEIVIVNIICYKLSPSDNKNLPKHGTCDVKFFPDRQSFQVDLVLKDTTEKTKTKYVGKIRQLPSKIIPERSTWTIERGKIVVKLCKEEENCDWTPMVRIRGLDQLGSDESS